MEQFATARVLRAFAVAASVAAAITCSAPSSPKLTDSDRPLGSATGTGIATLTLTIAQTVIGVGDTTTSFVTVRNAAGQKVGGGKTAWQSFNPSIASANSRNGVIVGVAPGVAKIGAVVDGVWGYANVTVTGDAPPPAPVATQVHIATQPGGAIAAAVLVPQPTIEIRDSANAIVTGSTAAVTATITSGSGTLSGATTVQAVAGIAAFSNLGISQAGTYTLTFTSPGLTSAVSNSVTITAPPQVATRLRITRQPGGAASGAALNPQPTVEVIDANDQRVAASAAPITARIASGTGTLLGTTTVNASAGVASFGNLGITGSGSYTVTFSASGLASATSSAITITAPPPPSATRLAMATQPAFSVVSGTLLVPQPAVRLLDASNNPVSQAGVSVTVAIASGGGTLGGTLTAATNTSGVATFSGLAISGVAGVRVLSFNAPGLTGVQSNPINVTIPSTPPPPAGVLFQSDWSTATGTSNLAGGDGGKWRHVGSQPGLEIIPSTGLDFPTANVARITVFPSGWPWTRVTGLPVPAPGESRFYRWYNRVVIPDDLAVADRETHPHQDGNAASDYNWGYHIWHDSPTPGRWMPQFRVGANENGYPNYRWGGYSDGGQRGPELLKNVTYRFEMQIHRLTATTFNMHVRIYNSAGTLLYDDDDFRNMLGTASLASNPTFTFHNVANLDGLNAGINGLGGAEWYPSVIYMYQGAIAVCATNWCGPYVR